jgi:hypothetical protein
MSTHFPSRLSDDELIADMTRLARCERQDVASLIARIAEFDERKLHLALGYGSLHQYCCEVLKLSGSEAYRRIEVARYARRYPLILEKLADGSVNLTTIDLVAPQLKPTNYQEVLEDASGKTKREVQMQVAALDPKPNVPFTTRPVPAFYAPRSSFKPLSPGCEQVTFTMKTSTIEKLNHARDLLSQAITDGDHGEVIDRALDLLLKDLERKRHAATDKPRPRQGTMPDSPDVPAWMQRAVWERDGGRCAFVGKNGRRCNSTWCLQYHHVIARAQGGLTTVENLQLRCAAHNRYEADLAYGPANRLKYAGTVSEARVTYRAGPPIRAGASSGPACAHRRRRTCPLAPERVVQCAWGLS